jgi:excisionase family DNA binding protein
MITVKPPSLRYAARAIGVSIPTLYRLISEGKLRSYHVGRAHRVSEDAIRDCVAALERESASRKLGSSLTAF